MSGGDRGRTDFDARLRRLFAGVDTAPGFEARVMQRVAARSSAPRTDLRAQFERARASAARNLARQAWMNVATAVGVGAAGIALVWRHRLESTQAVQAGSPPPRIQASYSAWRESSSPLGLWPVLRRYVTPL